MLKLAEQGHDVWFGNSRGTRYAKNREGKEMYDQEYWTFDMSDMGKYPGGDIPAFIDHIAPLPEKGDPKRVAYIGYSQGSFQMFYGLATAEEEYYGERIHRFIALAPCIFNSYYDWQYDETAEYYKSLNDNGDYYTEYGGYQSV